MTTGWGATHWEAPRIAWALARDTAKGGAEAAIKDIPREARPGVIIALGAQIRAFLCDAAMHGVMWQPEPLGWITDVPHARVRQFAELALSGATVRVPPIMCNECMGAALRKMTDALLDVMSAAGVPTWGLAETLDWLAARAR